MIKLGYEEIIEKIEEKSDLSKEEIQSKIDTKLKQLEGLISKEGAAHIVANQLGIKLIDRTSGELKIENIMTGMRDVETAGKIVRIYPPRQFTVDGREGQVGSTIIRDSTSSIRLVLWGDQADHLENLKRGDIVKVMGAYVKENNNQREIHLGRRGSLARNPEGIKIEVDVKSDRRKLSELQEGMDYVEILGTVVQIFDPRFYETCPECRKRVHLKEGKYVCDKHGDVEPSYGYVLNVFLDDGTDTTRIVFFRQQALDLLQKEEEEFLKYKDDLEGFEELRDELLGNITKIGGRVVRNDMFDRLEVIARNVDPNPDPEKELERLES